jgi:hypothetical protein
MSRPPSALNPDRDQRMHVDGAAVLADLDGRRVHPDGQVMARVEWPVAERLNLGVQMLRHLTDLGLEQLPHAELLGQLFHPSVEIPADRSWPSR